MSTRSGPSWRWIVLSLPLLGFTTFAGPCGPIPGSRLDGAETSAVGLDFAFVGESSPCAIETRPSDPHSVRASCFARGSTLYVRSIFAPRKRWPAYVAENPDVRVRLQSKIYPMRAVRILDDAERAGILAPGDPEDPPSETTWLYRLEPR
jgi:hypothetical protein